MPFQEIIDDLTGAWTRVTYGMRREDMNLGEGAREFRLDKIEVKLVNGKKYDIRDLVIDFGYHESIESSFLRCEINIFDTVDFNRSLYGGEQISMKMITSTADGEHPLETTVSIYKIGSISKSERGQLYTLHCVSPEMFHDEGNKIFKAFGPGDGATDDDCIPKMICEEYLKVKGNGSKIQTNNFENHSKYTFIACSWKPTDAINFISDKVTRLTESKGKNKQGGFLFWENRNGFNFRSLDSIAAGGATQNGMYTYYYTQKALEGVDPRYTIETITYPDKANHLTNMRMGTYKTAAIGISMHASAQSYAPDSGEANDVQEDEGATSTVDTVTASGGTGISSVPGGTISPPRILKFGEIFSKADTVHDQPSIRIPDWFDIEKAQPTRMKIRALPGMKNQTSTANVNNGTNPDIDTMAVAQYASARYNLFKSVKLDVTVPGNTALTAGDLIVIRIPAAKNEGETVKTDYRFSGKYIIAGLTHVYKRAGMTTKLYLVRDSQPKDVDK